METNKNAKKARVLKALSIFMLIIMAMNFIMAYMVARHSSGKELDRLREEVEALRYELKLAKEENDSLSERITSVEVVSNTNKKMIVGTSDDIKKTWGSVVKPTVPVKTEDKERITEFRWVSSRTYFKKEGRFRIAMTDEVMPYLTQLKGQFTQYQLKHIAYFNSAHSIRIYELITQYRSVGSREITVEKLKEWLQVEESYSRWNNFKARVLDPAISEINEKSDLFVEYEPIKKGRKVTGIEFRITHEKPVKKRPAFPHKNKYGKFVKLDTQNPKMSNAEYGNYARDCLKILEDFYSSLPDVTTEDLRHYWVFLTSNASFRSKLGKRSDFLNELQNRGYKIVNCELVKV